MATAFAKVTDLHDRISLQVTPCAGALYRFLLRKKPAGKQQELDIEEDFLSWSEGRRKRPYSLRHIQRALTELIDLGLVEVVKKFTGKIFKLIAYHPGQEKKIPSWNENVQNGTKMSKKGASNPHGCVPIIESVETTDSPPTNPVAVKNEFEGVEVTAFIKAEQDEVVDHPESESSSNQNPRSLEQHTNSDQISARDLKTKIFVEVEAAGFKLNSGLKAVILGPGVTAEAVRDAIAAVREYLASGKLLKRTSEALLSSAIQNKWKPAASAASAPEGFNEWFKLAYDLGVAGFSSRDADGSMTVITPNDENYRWETLRTLHPLEELRSRWNEFKEWCDLALSLGVADNIFRRDNGSFEISTPDDGIYLWEDLRILHPLEELRSRWNEFN